MGRNRRDTSWAVSQGQYHPLKGAIIPEDSNYGKGSSDEIRIQNGNSDVNETGQEVYLPLVLKAGNNNANTLISSSENFSSKVLFGMSATSNAHRGLIAVSLDRFDIENGGKHPLVKGNTSQVLTDNIATTVVAPSTTLNTHFILKAPTDFGYKNYASLIKVQHPTLLLPVIHKNRLMGHLLFLSLDFGSLQLIEPKIHQQQPLLMGHWLEINSALKLVGQHIQMFG